MANEHTISSVADLFADEVLSSTFLLTLAARDSSILMHPALSGSTGAPGSNVIKVPHIGYGADLATAATEASAHANTQLTDTHTDVTLAMYALRRNVGDFGKYVTQGRLGAQQLGFDLAVAYQQTMINIIANITDDFTATAGSTGVNLAWSDIIAAKGILGVADADGPMMAILHPQQWADLEANALSLTFTPAVSGNAGLLNSGLQSYKGRWFGVDIFTTTHVPDKNTAADHGGALITPGAIVWADAMFDDDPDPNIGNLGRARIERVREGEQFATSYVLSFLFGAAQGIDARGVSIISDHA